MMRLFAILVAIVVSSFSASVPSNTFTFHTFSGGYESGQGSSVSTTTSGITLTLTAPNTSVDVIDGSNYGGSTGRVGFNNEFVPTFVMTFSEPVDISSFRFADGYGQTGTYIFTPDVGPAFTAFHNDEEGVTVAPSGGFVGITSLTITRQDRKPTIFLVDDIVVERAR